MSITLVILSMLLQTNLSSVLPDANQVTIVDGGKPGVILRTGFDAGPAPGDILNGHFFPAVIGYNTGRYGTAVAEATFMVQRANYIDANPRQREFISVSY